MEALRRVVEGKEEGGEERVSEARVRRVSVTVRRQLTVVPKTFQRHRCQFLHPLDELIQSTCWHRGCWKQAPTSKNSALGLSFGEVIAMYASNSYLDSGSQERNVTMHCYHEAWTTSTLCCVAPSGERGRRLSALRCSQKGELRYPA